MQLLVQRLPPALAGTLKSASPAILRATVLEQRGGLWALQIGGQTLLVRNEGVRLYAGQELSLRLFPEKAGRILLIPVAAAANPEASALLSSLPRAIQAAVEELLREFRYRRPGRIAEAQGQQRSGDLAEYATQAHRAVDPEFPTLSAEMRAWLESQAPLNASGLLIQGDGEGSAAETLIASFSDGQQHCATVRSQFGPEEALLIHMLCLAEDSETVHLVATATPALFPLLAELWFGWVEELRLSGLRLGQVRLAPPGAAIDLSG